MPDKSIPLPRYPAPCWRCGAPSSRQGLAYRLCDTCRAMLREVQVTYGVPDTCRTEEEDSHG